MISSATFHVITTELVVGSFAMAGICFLVLAIQSFAFCIIFLTLVLTLQSRYLNDQEDLPKEIDQTNFLPKQEDSLDSTPPLPEGGLPNGWTLEQWKWYGHEYLEDLK